MLFGGWVGFVCFKMGLDVERASDVGLQTQPVSNKTASDQKAALVVMLYHFLKSSPGLYCNNRS